MVGAGGPGAAVPDPLWGSAVELAAAVHTGALRAEDIVKCSLARIAATDSQLGAFLTVDEGGARAAARAIDERRRAGASLGPLAGVPVGVKDNFTTLELPTTCGSRLLSDFVAPYDATVVARLRAADAVIVGKLNMDEFAMGSTGEHSAFGATRNPWSPGHVAGGSSSGSAAAVASGQCVLAVGTDTGGSVRAPAAFSGVVGLKPTYGRISRYGIVAFASSLEQCGPLARSVRDCALLLRVLAGADDRDATAARVPVPAYDDDLVPCVQGLRVGVPDEIFDAALDSEVRELVEQALAALEGLGATLVPVRLPTLPAAVACYYLIATSEASSNLARHDGVRYGRRVATVDSDVQRLVAESRGSGLGAEVKRRIMLGTFALSSGYYAKYYGRAMRVRTVIRAEMEAALQTCDVLAGPTCPVPASALGERLGDPLQMYLLDAYTVPANLAGVPALSVPCGFTSDGLPVGLQLTAPLFSEQRLLDAAAAYEQHRGPFDRRPVFNEEIG